LVNAKPIINIPENKGKRFHFSEAKYQTKARTIVHLDEDMEEQASKRSENTSLDTKGRRRYWLQGENSSHRKSQAGTLPLN
jgi:hypothetical protein